MPPKILHFYKEKFPSCKSPRHSCDRLNEYLERKKTITKKDNLIKFNNHLPAIITN